MHLNAFECTSMHSPCVFVGHPRECALLGHTSSECVVTHSLTILRHAAGEFRDTPGASRVHSSMHFLHFECTQHDECEINDDLNYEVSVMFWQRCEDVSKNTAPSL